MDHAYLGCWAGEQVARIVLLGGPAFFLGVLMVLGGLGGLVYCFIVLAAAWIFGVGRPVNIPLSYGFHETSLEGQQSTPTNLRLCAFALFLHVLDLFLNAFSARNFH